MEENLHRKTIETHHWETAHGRNFQKGAGDSRSSSLADLDWCLACWLWCSQQAQSTGKADDHLLITQCHCCLVPTAYFWWEVIINVKEGLSSDGTPRHFLILLTFSPGCDKQTCDKELGEKPVFLKFHLTCNNSFMLETSIYEELVFFSGNGLPMKQLSQVRKWYKSLEEYRQDHCTTWEKK